MHTMCVAMHIYVDGRHVVMCVAMHIYVDGRQCCLLTRSLLRTIANKNNRFITMGRGIYTEKLQKAIDKHKPNLGYFILGPTPRNISGSGVRAALKRGATDELDGLVHPAVLNWLQMDPKSPYARYYHQHLSGNPESTDGRRPLCARMHGYEALKPYLQSLPAGSRFGVCRGV